MAGVGFLEAVWTGLRAYTVKFILINKNKLNDAYVLI
jgi:hypothetical protein